MSLAQLVPSIAVASSNLIVSADAEDQAVTRIIDNINRMGFIASSHMKSAPVVKLSWKESRRQRPCASPPLHASAAGLQSADATGVEQQPVEAAAFRAVPAGLEHAPSGQHHPLLLLLPGIRRHAGGPPDYDRGVS